MSNRTVRESLSLAILGCSAAGGLIAAPSWNGAFLEPCHLAAICGGATAVLLFATRFLGPVGAGIERVWIGVFLAGMPLVYIARWFVATGVDASRVWLWVELAGFPIFVALAALGFKRSPWFLSAGIVAHGLGWDAWHLFGSRYVPAWYAAGCLVVDIGLGAYVAIRIPAWREAGPERTLFGLRPSGS